MLPPVPDRQLATLVRHIARIHLEVERGLRDPDQLYGWLAPAARVQLRQPGRPHFDRAGPVHPDDLGTVRLTRLRGGHIYATIPTRETGDRWGAILLELRTAPHDHRWWITGLQRLRQPPAPNIALPDPPAHSQPDPASTHQLETQEPSGAASARPAAAPPAGRTPVELLLGPRPASEHGQRLWDATREEIHRYRTRWQLTDYTHGVLGPLPDNPDHRRDRDRLFQLLRAVGPLLDRDTPHDQTRGGPSLGRER